MHAQQVIGLIALILLGGCVVGNIALFAIVCLMRRENRRAFDQLQADQQRIEADLETVKDYLMHRALTESVLKGIGEINSPWKLKDDKIPVYDAYQIDLRSAYADMQCRYKAQGKTLTDKDLFWEIANRFSARFATTICVQHHMTDGECVLGGAYIAKGCQPVEVPDGVTIPC